VRLADSGTVFFQQRNTYTGGTTIYQALLRLNQNRKTLETTLNENWVARQYNTRQSKLLRTVNVK
jgi:autotransporter-associated beta strand protein